VLEGAAAVVAGSRFAAESVPGLLGVTRPVDVLPYGVDVAPAQRGAAGSRATPLRFGVLGAVMPHKGVHVAVDAFRGIDPARARLEIWGGAAGMPDFARALQEGAPPAVRFAGPLPEGEKAERLAGLDALLVPSLGLESFGIAAREALALGVPVLASRRGALVEAFAEGEGGAFFEPGDVAGLRSWIDRLCTEPDLLDTWARRRPQVGTVDEQAEAIEAVYARVMAGRGRP
jgi:glycosyltransferase involved in cell wall biosynthesis